MGVGRAQNIAKRGVAEWGCELGAVELAKSRRY